MTRPAQNDELPARCAIGLDVGGTKTAGGIVTATGKIVVQETISTQAQRGGEPVARDVLELAERLIVQAATLELSPAAIGISVCELVDDRGELVSDETLKWRGLPVKQRFSRLRPTKIEADARAAAYCEAHCGAGRGFPVVLYVTIGTGISCSLVLDGKPYVGAHGNTGTLATGSLTTVCSECRGLSTSVLERIAAGPAIVTRYRNRGEDKVERCESVLAAAEQGDAIALEVIYQAAESLGSAIALMIDVLDPHAVVIGGGLGSAAGLFWESLHAATRRHIWCDAHRQLPIVQAAYGPTSALVGAALLALGE